MSGGDADGISVTCNTDHGRRVPGWAAERTLAPLDAARVANPVPHATSNTRCPGRTTAAISAAMNGFMRGAT